MPSRDPISVDAPAIEPSCAIRASEVSGVWQAGYFNDPDRGFHHTFDHHVDDLLHALQQQRPPPVHARAGRRARALAIINSFETGTRIDIPPDADTSRS